jgi:uncharacterized cysteine cluster protein YcgN (CxxCxxCC family)
MIRSDNKEARYWEKKKLSEMSTEEWESLCDRCGKCCLHKLEDEDSGDVYYTQVTCRYMDDDCNCTSYKTRSDLVPDCITLRPQDVGEFHWLPNSCAYRVIHEGRSLQSWHPLISGDSNSVHLFNASVKGKVLNEDNIHSDDMEEYIINWVND